jgi:hypothetical protein
MNSRHTRLLSLLVFGAISFSVSAQTATPSKQQLRAEFRAATMTDKSGYMPADALMAAKAQADLLRRPTAKGIGEEGAGITSASWEALGPGNIGGRVRALAIHPTDPNWLVLGSASGGIWISSNAGASWQPSGDWLPSLAASVLVFSPTTPNTIFAGTGEGTDTSVGSPTTGGKRGAGVFKSSDSGTTWTRVASTNPAASATAANVWTFVNDIAIHPTNGQVLFVATKTAVMKTSDGGTTWQAVNGSNGQPLPGANSIKFNPADANNIIATGASGVRYTINGGQTAFLTGNIPSGGDRTQLAHASNGWAFVFRQGDGKVYRSQDSGANWSVIGTPVMEGQLWYNNSIWVDPSNPSRILVGNQTLRQSVNGGGTWQVVGGSCNNQFFHADQHVIVNDRGYNGTSNRKVYVGNDGGLYRADDLNFATDGCDPVLANGWTNLNNGLAITEFTGGAGSDTVLFGGTQDNGSIVRESGTTWRRYVSGDGGPVAYATAAPTYLFGQYQVGQTNPVHVSPDGGLNIYGDPAHFELGCRSGEFYSPMAMHESATAWITGGIGLCVSENPTTIQRNWRQLDARPTPAPTPVSAVAIAKNNKNVVWYAEKYNGYLTRCFPDTFDYSMCQRYGVFKSANALGVSPTWQQVGDQLPTDLPITRIYIDPRDASNQTVYVLFGGFANRNIWKTTTGGTTWTNIHGSLPAAPIRAVSTHPTIPNYLYVGTEVGLFTSENNGQTWYLNINNLPQNDGPGNVSVEQLFWSNNQTLVAVTYGRGMFRATVAPAACNLDVDGNGSVAGLSDGLLIYRALLGQNPATLATGALGAGATRTNGTAIVSFISNQGLALDVDGNGVVSGLSDGLLIYRTLLGLSNSSITTGALGAGATRTTGLAIKAYLNERCGTNFVLTP